MGAELGGNVRSSASSSKSRKEFFGSVSVARLRLRKEVPMAPAMSGIQTRLDLAASISHGIRDIMTEQCSNGLVPVR